jgi:hypothetical protein
MKPAGQFSRENNLGRRAHGEPSNPRLTYIRVRIFGWLWGWSLVRHGWDGTHSRVVSNFPVMQNLTHLFFFVAMDNVSSFT